MKGIVHDGSKVLYKFNTDTLPALNAGEEIKLRDDIDAIQTGAQYVPGTDTYTNPVPVPPPDWKAQYAAADTDSKKLLVIAQKLGLV